MGSRYWDLVWTVAGREQTGVPLVETCGKALIASADGLDDVGSYYFIPEFSLLFAIPIARSITLFYDASLCFGFLTGAIGFLCLYRTRLARAVALIGLLLLTALSYRIGDVYIFYFVTAAVVVPWMLVLIRLRADSLWPFAFFIIAGILIETANLVRTNAGTAALLFICLILFLQASAGRRQKVAFLLCFLVGLLVPAAVVSKAISQSNAFLRSRDPEFSAPSRKHVLWHSVYSGLGYLQNEYGFKWDDEATLQKAQSVVPAISFGSPQYERVLRKEVLRAVWYHPWFTFETLSAKLGVTFAVIVLFANIGLLAAFARPKPWAVEISFLAAIVFNSLFGLVAIPVQAYMLGVFCFAGLYGIVSLGFFLEGRSGEAYRRLSWKVQHREDAGMRNIPVSTGIDRP